MEYFPDGRLQGSYAETAFEEVIEANRRGTWTINAAVIGKVEKADFTQVLLKRPIGAPTGR
jgi:hypothetical protein